MISFVGAGPGAADLITVRGLRRLEAAELVIWPSSLVPREVLAPVPAGATVLDSAGMTLEDVLDAYRSHPDSAVVRLHSGDPSLYGALAEQIDWCVSEGRPFEIVPGVSSLGAAAACVQRELTLPGISQSVVITRLASRTSASVPEQESVRALAAHGVTMAVFLSAARPDALADELCAEGSGYDATTPAAIVIRATWPDERIVWTTLGELAADLKSTGVTTTVLVLVGDVLGTARGRRSHLYSPAFAHAHRRRSKPGSTAGRPASPKRSGAGRAATGREDATSTDSRSEAQGRQRAEGDPSRSVGGPTAAGRPATEP